MTTDKRDCSPDLRRFDTELRYFRSPCRFSTATSGADYTLR